MLAAGRDVAELLVGEKRPELGVVHVALHRGDGPVALEVQEHAHRREVAGVDDRVRRLQESQAFPRQGTRAARKVCVTEERDQKRSGRNSPFR